MTVRELRLKRATSTLANPIWSRHCLVPGGGMIDVVDQELAASFSSAMRSSPLRIEPWRYSYVETLLPSDLARTLSRGFSGVSLVAHERASGPKSYSFLTASLADPARVTESACQDLLAYLGSNTHRDLLSDLSGVDLTGCSVSLDVWEYRPGHWLAPHVDKRDKTVTQIIYLTEGWRPEHGGRLEILRDATRTSVVEALPPTLGSSVVLVRSDASWHAVEPISAASVPRRSLTVMFRREDDNAA